ncbi:MAG TPA: hypothetical protein PK308_10270, partial [Phycisphaerales bacterium]|nr:hypothetical protein [Phycisphaerales bacterium]
MLWRGFFMTDFEGDRMIDQGDEHTQMRQTDSETSNALQAGEALEGATTEGEEGEGRTWDPDGAPPERSQEPSH